MDDRIVMRKANRIIRVTENEYNRYLANGYEVVNQPSNKVADEPTKVVTKIDVTPEVVEVSEDIPIKRRRRK